MLKRIITAIVALLAFVPILIWGGDLGRTAAFALICGFSVYEMLGCCGMLKNYFISIPSIIGSAACVFVPYVSGPRIFGAATCLLAAVVLVLIYFLFYGVFNHKNVNMERLLMFFALAVYITAGFTALSTMGNMYGVWAISFVLVVAWATDTFAYFSGMLFGKRKLCPEISPKKTIAGAVGGTLLGTLAGVLVFVIAGKTWYSGFCALPLSIISQLGDLAASVIKRRFGVKDYGKIFPGHGGVLDRFDSIIPVSIMSALYFLGTWVLTSVL